MASIFRRFEQTVYLRLRREPPRDKLHRTVFWTTIAYLVLGPFRMIAGGVGGFFTGLSFLILTQIVFCCIPLLWRWVFSRLLWKVRNRLVVTYLLMGLAPVLLLVSLGLFAAYIFSGQFASFAATSEINRELAHVSAENRAFALHVAHSVHDNPRAATFSLPELDDSDAGHQHVDLQVAAFEDGKVLVVTSPQARPGVVREVPQWVNDGYSGMVCDAGRLYLRAVDSQTVGAHTVTVVSSLPLHKENVDQIADRLGVVIIYPEFDMQGDSKTGRGGCVRDQGVGTADGPLGKTATGPPPGSIRVGDGSFRDLQQGAIQGGSLPAAIHFYDMKVEFPAPLPTRVWANGQDHASLIRVESRPSLLYQRLFITSLEIGSIIQEILITIGVLFALLELVAFVMGMRLNRTITGSVRDLYQATEQIDGGNLRHRIRVTRKDQLAALSRSFNNMAASLEKLLEEQREKERLQNELAIAQEVQANLFPQGDILFPTLEVHGVCRPARSVSGDYYDFLQFHRTSLGIALGDISGKGISAALLMATLHSAVRAYLFAGEELITAGTQPSRSPTIAAAAIQTEEVDCGELFESPGKVLALLNRHLYRSTQPEKYATLFLAFYDGLTSRLTYSNGGQLPPILLGRDGSAARLDCGGTVVGLLEGMSYEQGTVTLKKGDILVAYSDGVTEPENEFGDFGEERLLEIVRTHQNLSLAAISDHVMQALKSWIGAQEQPDDITLVLARQL